VPLAAEVAAALRSPLDVFIVRGSGRLVMKRWSWTIAGEAVRVINDDVVGTVNLTENRMKSMRSCGQ
jgi:predicted phosphoribosyltransferase